MPSEITLLPNHFSEAKGQSFVISTAPPLAGYSSRSPYNTSSTTTHQPHHVHTASQGGFPLYVYNNYPSLQARNSGYPTPRIHLMPIPSGSATMGSSSPPHLPPHPSTPPQSRPEINEQPTENSPAGLNLTSPSLAAHIVETPVAPLRVVNPSQDSRVDSPTSAPFVLTYTETPPSRLSAEDESEEALRKRRSEEETFRRKRDSEARVQLREERGKEKEQEQVTPKPRGSSSSRRSVARGDQENIPPLSRNIKSTAEEDLIRKQKDELQKKEKKKLKRKY
jgi:hypothetical protein